MTAAVSHGNRSRRNGRIWERISACSPLWGPAVDFPRGAALLKLIIVDDEGRRTVVPFVRQEITIGRQEGNTIRLTERNVSRHHARLLRQNGAVVVEDLGSCNGVRVNGARMEGAASVSAGDRVQIGDYELAVDDDSVRVTPDRMPTR